MLIYLFTYIELILQYKKIDAKRMKKEKKNHRTNLNYITF